MTHHDEFGPEPPRPSRRAADDDRLSDIQIERRLTALETTVKHWKWLIAVGIAGLGAAAAAARLFGT